jgi:lipopolysaccharide export LptBFGC system permease protein LptF
LFAPRIGRRPRALSLVLSDASVLVRHVERNKQQIEAQKRIQDKYNIEIQKKYSIPSASLAFVLIGAPLGISRLAVMDGDATLQACS